LPFASHLHPQLGEEGTGVCWGQMHSMGGGPEGMIIGEMRNHQNNHYDDSYFKF